jgi:hypothetical protein
MSLTVRAPILSKLITGALVIFIVDGRWASFTIADSFVVIGELFRRLSLLPAHKKVVVRLGASGITAKLKD